MEVNGDITWYQYIKSFSLEELADFLSHYRCGNCIRRMSNCFPADTESWLQSKIGTAESLEISR